MTGKLNIDEVRTVNETLQNIVPASLSSNPHECYNLAIWCATMRAYTGEQMAIAKKEWMDAKKKGYESFVLSNEANQAKVEKFGVMVVKDYISAKCGDKEAQYEYIERTNNSLGSMEDVLRTVISALKQEMYSQRV